MIERFGERRPLSNSNNGSAMKSVESLDFKSPDKKSPKVVKPPKRDDYTDFARQHLQVDNSDTQVKPNAQ